MYVSPTKSFQCHFIIKENVVSHRNPETVRLLIPPSVGFYAISLVIKSKLEVKHVPRLL